MNDNKDERTLCCLICPQLFLVPYRMSCVTIHESINQYAQQLLQMMMATFSKMSDAPVLANVNATSYYY